MKWGANYQVGFLCITPSTNFGYHWKTCKCGTKSWPFKFLLGVGCHELEWARNCRSKHASRLKTLIQLAYQHQCVISLWTLAVAKFVDSSVEGAWWFCESMVHLLPFYVLQKVWKRVGFRSSQHFQRQNKHIMQCKMESLSPSQNHEYIKKLYKRLIL